MESETINIEAGNGPLEIIGDKYDSALLLNGELIQFTYLREIGSTWRYQVAKGITENALIAESKFRNFVKNGYLSNDSLIRQFSYILKLLARGQYQIEIIELEKEIGSIEISRETDGYYCFDTYGGMVEVLETQSEFNEEIVKEYMDLIEEGQEPIIILLKTQNSENTFLIDGHHKFAAYGRSKRSAKCLQITKLQSHRIEKDQGLEFLANCNSHAEYRNRFLDRA